MTKNSFSLTTGFVLKIFIISIMLSSLALITGKVMAQSNSTTSTDSTTSTTTADTYTIDDLTKDGNENFGINACSIQPVDSENKGSVPNTNESIISTIQIKMPLLKWLNGDESTGTSASPFTTPCIVDTNEDAAGSVDWCVQYSVNSALRFGGGNSLAYTPIQANGAVALYNDFRNFTGQSQIKPEEFKNLIGISYSERGREKVKQSVLKKFTNFVGITNSPDRVGKFSYNVNQCSGVNKIDRLYNDDVLESPEHIVKKTVTAENLQGENINSKLSAATFPFLLKGLGVAYEEELYKLNLMGFTCQRTIHRNRVGVKATVTQRFYEYNGQSFPGEEVEDGKILRKKTNPAKGEDPYEKIDVGDMKGQRVFDVYYPWIGQTREMYKRLANVYSDFTRDEMTTQSYYKLFYKVNEQITKKKDLDTKIGGFSYGANEPLDQLDFLLKDNNTLFYCQDIDTLSGFLRNNFGDNGDAKHIVDLIGKTDCVDNRACTPDQSPVNSNLVDPLQEFLCKNKAIDAKLCEGTDVPVEEPVQCTTNAYPTDLSEDITTPVTGTGNTSGTGIVSPTVGRLTQVKSPGHPGIDIGAVTGTPVKSIAQGRVLYAGKAIPGASTSTIFTEYGNVVIISHNNGQYCSLYAHLNKVITVSGKNVSAGELIAEVGSEGRSTGPHLHLEIRKGCGPVKYTEPNNFIDPICVFYGNCTFSLNNGGNNSGGDDGDSGDIEQPMCEVDDTTTVLSDFDPTNIQTQTKSILDVINPAKCGGATGWLATNGNTPEDRYLIDLSKSIGKQTGIINKGNIYSLAGEISRATNVPIAKLMAHLHIETFGVNAASANLNSYYNGYADQTIHSEPNICGCLGPGQFCPGTARGYFMPYKSGTCTSDKYKAGKCEVQLGYQRVYECMRAIGITTLKYGDPINPSTAAAGMCAMAIKLKAQSGAGDSFISKTCDPASCFGVGNNFDEASCPNTLATKKYFGSCVGTAAQKYCYQTSSCDSDTLLSRYKTANF